MPFVKRVVAPKYDNELEAITNLTLSNALRQLASLLLISNEIFAELNKELEQVTERSMGMKQRIEALVQKVDQFDPKLVPVPESDLITVSNIKEHPKRKQQVDTSLFTPESRTETLKELYEAAAKTPVPVMDELDKILGENRRRSSDAFMCTPVLGQLRRKMKSKVDLEIEARMPAELELLRKWTSFEAIGDITVDPRVASLSMSTVTNTTFAASNTSRDVPDNTVLETSEVEPPLDHRLPSPEEQQRVIAAKYPAEFIRVDVSGKRFDRMSAARKSLLHVQMGVLAKIEGTPEREPGEGCGDDESGGDTIKRRSRSRKPRGKRRNTIAGTDGKEIEDAAKGESTIATITTTMTSSITNESSNESSTVPRSKSSDILKNKESPSNRQSHFNTLKQWGRNRLRQITSRVTTDERPAPLQLSQMVDKDVSDIDDFNINETIRINGHLKAKRAHEKKLLHERKPSYSSSERSVPATSVKLREVPRRRRIPGAFQKEEPHSSSGNWSASSESGRTSIGSEITTNPKSSASSSSLNHHHLPSSGPPSSIISRRRFLNTSASSSITSEGTATPDLQMDFHDEDGSSSVYSCDTEGYYTSFHVDSGLKTLKEEEPPTPPKSSTTSFESSGNQTVISPENEYELFGRGSTSTTTSSAGTVCTTILADRPSVPERKSSLSLARSSSSVSDRNLERSYSNSTVGSMERMGTIKRNGVLLQKEVAALVHQAKEELVTRTESPDSGNNTSSSPIETNSNSSPTQVRSNSELEYSESSDLECVDRIERIRVKTTMNAARIPSMCIITPGNSDDEEKRRKNSDSTDEFPKVVEIEFGTEPQYEVPKVPLQVVKKTTLLPLNFMGKLKGVLPSLKKSPNKEAPLAEEEDDFMFEGHDPGEYVTIAETNNNQNRKKQGSGGGVYYSNDVVKRNLATVLSGNLNNQEEYVSLNELPCNIRFESNLGENVKSTETTTTTKCMGEEEQEGNLARKGARVQLDAHGKVVYSSDSLKRRKAAHTTFIPGPCIKKDDRAENSVTNEPATSAGGASSPSLIARQPVQVKPVKKSQPPASQAPTASMQTYLETSQHFLKQDQGPIPGDYQPSSLDSRSSGYVKPSYLSTTLPRFSEQPPEPVTSMDPFQRGNSVYWTLQSRPRTTRGFDLNVAQTNISTSDLYATPKLRTTRQGFDNYFSPISGSSSPVASPLSPTSFQTSTPQGNGVQSPTRGLADEIRNRLRLQDNGIRSSGNSPISSGRSTPRLEPQTPRSRHSWASQNAEVPQTCADRMKPKTSLMDFKKLLLEHGKSNVHAPKKSAVEMLKLSKNDPLSPSKPTSLKPNVAAMNILDLSGSPKTFATRRMIRQGNFGPNSPVKNGGGIVPVPKHSSSGSRQSWRYNNIRNTDVISTAIPEVNSEEDSPNNAVRKLQPPDDRPSLRDNIFLKTEENNFMKHELPSSKAPNSLITRAQLQAQRAQFLLGHNNNNNNNTKPLFGADVGSNSAPTTPSLETAL